MAGARRDRRCGGAGRAWRAGFAVAIMLVAAGCATGERLSTELFHDLPDEETPQPAFPAVGATPPPRPTPAMTDDERKKAEDDLRALAKSRQRGVEKKLDSGR